jgi:predicted pyridoxine 5'-phosphate oxidase superfamily flavin-nucleotide-binding protein
MISEEMKTAMKGIIPSTMSTCNSEGVPNISYISQLYYVDENHVAISNQFFNKTIRNIQENPLACVNIVSPENFSMWVLDLKYSHSETESDLFEQMEMQLEAIASMQGMEDVFKLKAAEVFTLLSVNKI